MYRGQTAFVQGGRLVCVARPRLSLRDQACGSLLLLLLGPQMLAGLLLITLPVYACPSFHDSDFVNARF